MLRLNFIEAFCIMAILKRQKIISTLDEVRCAVSAIEEKKGEDICVLNVHDKSSITDYMIIASGTSEPHIKAIKKALDESLSRAGIQLFGEEGAVDSGWIVVDAFDFVIHLQTKEMREYYQMEQLWKDAQKIEL